MGDDVDLLCVSTAKLGRKSWVAYIQTVFLFVMISTLMFLFYCYWPSLTNYFASLGAKTREFHDPIYFLIQFVFVSLIGFSIYKIVALRICYLYYVESGVWLSSGVFPWDRRRIGVKRRDLDEAAFVPTFLNWIVRSHTVTIRHRFTKDGEIIVDKIHRGTRSVSIINGLKQELVQINNKLKRQYNFLDMLFTTQ